MGSAPSPPAQPQPSLEASRPTRKGVAESGDAEARGRQAAIERFPKDDRALAGLLGRSKPSKGTPWPPSRRCAAWSRLAALRGSALSRSVVVIELSVTVDEAFDALKPLADAQDRAAFASNLARASYAMGAIAAQGGTAIYYLTKAAETDTTTRRSASTWANAYLLDQQAQAARYWLREAGVASRPTATRIYLLSLARASSARQERPIVS